VIWKFWLLGNLRVEYFAQWILELPDRATGGIASSQAFRSRR
jgi:hypothetical protein